MLPAYPARPQQVIERPLLNARPASKPLGRGATTARPLPGEQRGLGLGGGVIVRDHGVDIGPAAWAGKGTAVTTRRPSPREGGRG